MKRRASQFASGVVIALASFVIGAADLDAATAFYLSPTGSDSNPGTISQPFLTLRKGFGALAPGDTLYIRGGTYLKQRVDVVTSGTAQAYKSVQNYPGETVVFDGQNTTDPNISGVSMKFSGVSYWNLSGITMANWICAGIYLRDASHVNLSDLVIHDVNNPYEVSRNPYGSEGIMGEGSTHISVFNTRIYSVGITSPPSRKRSRLDHAVYVGGGCSHWTFGHNVFHDTIGCGIHFYAGESHKKNGGSHSRVYNSILYNNAMSGVLLSDNTQSYVLNNTFCGNGLADIDLYSHATNTTIVNNIFGSRPGSSGHHVLWRNGTSQGNVVDYNSYRMASRAAANGGASRTFAAWRQLGYEPHGVSGEPMFLDESRHDLRVRGASNTLGTASAKYSPRFDHAYKVRQAPGQDMGAHDYNLAYDDFEGGSPSVHTPLNGTWRVVADGSRVYRQSDAAGGAGTASFTGSTSWINYNVTSTVKVLAGSVRPHAGVIGRATEALTHYYLAYLTPDGVQLWKNLGGAWTRLGASAGSYPVGNWHTVMLRCNGSNLLVSVDGAQKIVATDGSLSKGGCGFYAEGPTEFDEYFVAEIR